MSAPQPLSRKPAMRRIAFWALVPFLIPQGLLLRRNAPRFPPAAGPCDGLLSPAAPESAPAIRMLAIGDSIIAGVGAKRVELALPGQVAHALVRRLNRAVQWQAIGRIGLDAREVKRDLVPLLPAQPFDVIVVSVGVNDVTSLKRSSRWRSELGALIDALKHHSPGAMVALMGVPPLGSFPLLRPPLRTAFGIRAKSFDAIASEVAAERAGVAHIPLTMDAHAGKFSADGYHPSAESYAELGEHVARAISPQLNAA